jgi:hypothetical protein
MRIVNTAGWDTDCNAGNVGCLFGIRTGLAGIDAGPDFRTPIADRMYISTADGGGSITDAVIEAQSLIAAGHILAGSSPTAAAKNGARFNFNFPGSLQGFAAKTGAPAYLHQVEINNVPSHSRDGERSLAVKFERLAPGRVARIATPTFLDKDVFTMPIYELLACPTLYSGQLVECRLETDGNGKHVTARLYASVYDERDELKQIYSDKHEISSASEALLTWRLPDTGGYPIFEVGLEIDTRDRSGVDGVIYLDYLTWTGAPKTVLRRPDDNLSTMWKHAWVSNASQFNTRWEGLRVSNGKGIGFIAQGSRDWKDYRVRSEITPLLAEAWGLAARIQGRERYYAVMFDKSDGGCAKLVKRVHDETVLKRDHFSWQLDQKYVVELQVEDNEIQAFVDGRKILEFTDTRPLPLTGGGVGLVVDTGSISTQAIHITSL